MPRDSPKSPPEAPKPGSRHLPETASPAAGSAGGTPKNARTFYHVYCIQKKLLFSFIFPPFSVEKQRNLLKSKTGIFHCAILHPALIAALLEYAKSIELRVKGRRKEHTKTAPFFEKSSSQKGAMRRIPYQFPQKPGQKCKICASNPSPRLQCVFRIYGKMEIIAHTDHAESPFKKMPKHPISCGILRIASIVFWHSGGRGWIRTIEAKTQQIYSLPPLATREHSHIPAHQMSA